MTDLAESVNRAGVLESSRRLVIKLGTAVLMSDDGGLALSRFYSFVESIAALKRNGREVLLVSSGAVGLGVQRLALTRRPTDLPMIQACAAVGQGILLSMYSDAFDKLGVRTAQVLLSAEDFSSRKRYLNLRSTISELLKMGVLPVINENDTVSTSELESLAPSSGRRVNFGDNDKLSALVASKMDADLLIVLTDVDGIFSSDPYENENARLIDTISDVESYMVQIESSDGSGTVSSKEPAHSRGRGGITCKIEAADVVTKSGCSCIVANGKADHVISRIFDGEKLGTLFLPQRAMTGKSRWIAFATNVEGSVTINEGAKDALIKRKASLLPAGVTAVGGDFSRGDVVSILDEAGKEFARGIVNYNSEEARLVKGKHSDSIDDLIESRNYDALITRDNIAFTKETWKHRP